jgi:asparagine synthetase B (glutamine-hydrolysing)
MPAISGYYRLDGRRPEPDVGEVMVKALRHRGPVLSVTRAGPVLLGQNAVPSGPGGPAARPGPAPTPSCITFDGRLDRRARLGQRLGLPPDWVAASSDAQLALCAYHRWGMEMPRELSGVFALGIWDQSRHRLFLARDRLGARPLYYYHRSVAGRIPATGGPRKVSDGGRFPRADTPA